MKPSLQQKYLTHKGFTLLEVMIALLIIAVTLFALLRVMAIQANHQHYLEDKTYAQWVALNIADQIQLGMIALPTHLDELEGTTELMNKTWYWRADFHASEDQEVLQTSITVQSEKKGTSLIELSTYLTPSAEKG